MCNYFKCMLLTLYILIYCMKWCLFINDLVSV